MECCYLIIGICGAVFLYHLFGAIFFYYVTDEELIDLVGADWKDINTIFDEMISTHSSQWRIVKPSNTENLQEILIGLHRQGYLDYRRNSSLKTIPLFPDRAEFRLGTKKYPKDKRKYRAISRKVCLQGI